MKKKRGKKEYLWREYELKNGKKKKNKGMWREWGQKKLRDGFIMGTFVRGH